MLPLTQDDVRGLRIVELSFFYKGDGQLLRLEMLGCLRN